MEKTVKKVDLWTIGMYLILYSMAGFVIETLFGVVTKGVIESRKSFLYGPFCCIYGIGAIAMILVLRNEKNLTRLFFGGALIGAVVEYLMSAFCEQFFGVKWWDYSDFFLNIHGRTCLFFAASWGVLAIFLIRYVNPSVDYWIAEMRNRKTLFKAVTAGLLAFFAADALLTSFAIKIFFYRMAAENHLPVRADAAEKYAQIREDAGFAGFVNAYYDNEKMLKNYPNIMIAAENQKDVYAEDLLKRHTVVLLQAGRCQMRRIGISVKWLKMRIASRGTFLSSNAGRNIEQAKGCLLRASEGRNRK